LKINAGSLECPFNSQKWQCLVASAKQPIQIPCILDFKNFAFDPYVGKNGHLTEDISSVINIVLISYKELSKCCVLKLA